MGFFTTFVTRLGEEAVKKKEEQYMEMPLKDLKRLWDEEFAKRPYKEENMYPEISTLAALDRVYSRRAGKATWKDMYTWRTRK